MSWFNEIMGDQEKDLNDKDIANDLLARSKFEISSLAMAITEASNPQLRDMLGRQLNSSISDHYKLSDMAVKKNWYKAYLSPDAQLREDYRAAENIT